MSHMCSRTALEASDRLPVSGSWFVYVLQVSFEALYLKWRLVRRFYQVALYSYLKFNNRLFAKCDINRREAFTVGDSANL